VSVTIRKHESVDGVYRVQTRIGETHLATKNLVKGVSVYGEKLVTFRGAEYRVWNPYRSKLAAYIQKGATTLPIRESSSLLYLGAGSGTTVSHVSDIVGTGGKVFCIEFAQRVLRELVDSLCDKRPNLYPVLADARFPEKYPSFVTKTEGIYCDIAQAEQAKILADNAELYLGSGGRALIAFKARSINVALDPKEVFRKEIKVLKDRGFEIKDVQRLEPFQLDHAMVLATYE